MIPGWLKSLVTWIIGLFVHETVEQVKEQVQKPSTITDEKFPDGLSDGLRHDIADKLRNLDSGGR